MSDFNAYIELRDRIERERSETQLEDRDRWAIFGYAKALFDRGHISLDEFEAIREQLKLSPDEADDIWV